MLSKIKIFAMLVTISVAIIFVSPLIFDLFLSLISKFLASHSLPNIPPELMNVTKNRDGSWNGQWNILLCLINIMLVLFTSVILRFVNRNADLHNISIIFMTLSLTVILAFVGVGVGSSLIGVCGLLIPLGILIGGLSILAKASGEQCPDCGRFSAETEVSRSLQNQSTGWRTVTRKQDVKDQYGNVIGSTSYQEQVRVLENTYEHIMECKYCGARWRANSKSEYENFNE